MSEFQDKSQRVNLWFTDDGTRSGAGNYYLGDRHEEPEITDEMLEAGAEAYADCDPLSEETSYRETARRIFTAMWIARKHHA